MSTINSNKKSRRAVQKINEEPLRKIGAPDPEEEGVIKMKVIPQLKNREPVLLKMETVESDIHQVIAKLEKAISVARWIDSRTEIALKRGDGYTSEEIALLWYIIKRYDVIQLCLQQQGVVLSELQKLNDAVISFKLFKYL